MLAKRPSCRVVAVPISQPVLPAPAPPERTPSPHDRLVPAPAAQAAIPRSTAGV
jgi:hypothetical protein